MMLALPRLWGPATSDAVMSLRRCTSSVAPIRSCEKARPCFAVQPSDSRRFTSSVEQEPDVVVVGAGCAGVAAATALTSEKLSVLLLEQDPLHLGGRARSWPCPETGHPMHIGPHIVYSDYPNYFKLIRMLDPEGKEKIVWQRKKDVFTTVNGKSKHDPHNKFHSWPLSLLNSSEGSFLRRVPPPLNWIPTVLRDPFVPSIRDALSLVPFGAFCLHLQGNNEIINAVFKRHSSTGTATCASAESGASLSVPPEFARDFELWQRLDEISGQELLDAFGVSAAYMEHVMAFVGNSIINVPLKEVSGATLVSFFRKLVGRPGVRLGFTDGGLGTVLEPVGPFLENKQEGVNGLKMGTRVTAIRRLETDESRLEVEMVDSQSGHTSVVRPKHGVVVTLPPLEALKILPEQDKARPLDRLMAHVSASDKRAIDVSSDEDTPDTVLSRFKPCKYVSVYLWFDKDIRKPAVTAHADSQDPVAFSGHQFWAKRYDPDDLCCEFYDYSKIYTRAGTTPPEILDDLGIPSKDSAARTSTPCISMVGVNMIDVDRLDPPDSVDTEPVCSWPAPVSLPEAQHLAASTWTDEQLAQRALAELKESVGEESFNQEAKLLKSAVHRIPMAIPRMVVGTEMRRPIAGELHANSNLFVAGDYCQTGFMNCMEGATQAGFECADEVLAKIPKIEGASSASSSKTPSSISLTANQWALPHPSISNFAHLLSRYVVWPVSRRLWAPQLNKAVKIFG